MKEINIKKIDKLSKLELKNNEIVILDSTEDKEYLESLGIKCLNINNLHKELENNENFIDELNKLLFISTKLDKSFDETIIEIGNFITEFSIYSLEEKLEKNLNINHKNLETIKNLFHSYKEYKKENNFYDILDGLDKTIENYDKNLKTIYLYNINYTDEKRFKVIEKIISLSQNVFILKENNISYSYFERQILTKYNKNSKDILKNHHTKILATKKTFETKLSIYHFLESYKKENPNENLGVFVINENEFNFILNHVKHIELNFIYSLLKIREKEFSVYDIDNVLLFLNKHEERKKLFEVVKSAFVFKNIDDIINFFNIDELKKLLNILKETKNKIINKLIMDYKFNFLEKIEKYLSILPEENFASNFKNVLFLYLAKKEKIKKIQDIDKVAFSEIKEKDKVFVLYGGLKKQKDSFLADNHRKQLGLVHSELYIQLQIEYIKSLIEFDNVVVLDYKYNVNEVNENKFPFELNEFETNLKMVINKDLEIVHKIDYSNIIQEKIDTISLNDLHYLLEDKNKIVENYLNLNHDYLLNLSEKEIEKYFKKFLFELFENEKTFLIIKDKKIENLINEINKKLETILKSNLPIKFKSKILFFKNKLRNYLLEEIKRFENIECIENNIIYQVDYSISELNKKRIGIDIEIDRIDHYIKSNSVDIVFYDKEPYTWYNKYHKTKILKELLKLKGMNVKEIKYFNLF